MNSLKAGQKNHEKGARSRPVPFPWRLGTCIKATAAGAHLGAASRGRHHTKTSGFSLGLQPGGVRVAPGAAPPVPCPPLPSSPRARRCPGSTPGGRRASGVKCKTRPTGTSRRRGAVPGGGAVPAPLLGLLWPPPLPRRLSARTNTGRRARGAASGLAPVSKSNSKSSPSRGTASTAPPRRSSPGSPRVRASFGGARSRARAPEPRRPQGVYAGGGWNWLITSYSAG